MRRLTLPYDGPQSGLVWCSLMIAAYKTVQRGGAEATPSISCPGGMPCNVVRRSPCAIEDERDSAVQLRYPK
jgi:hypothetical protein